MQKTWLGAVLLALVLALASTTPALAGGGQRPTPPCVPGEYGC